jgi:phosphate-selective porin OprO and OprP
MPVRPTTFLPTRSLEALKQQTEFAPTDRITGGYSHTWSNRMKRIRNQTIAALLGASVIASGSALADETLTARLEALEKKWAEAPVITAGERGFSLAAPDKSFELKLSGLVQADARFFFGDDEKPQSDTFLLRRVRPTLEGKVGNHGEFRITPDFAGSATTLLEGYGGYNVSPALNLRVGKFKAPFGLERLQSGANLRFIERAHPTSLAPNRDIGVQVSGDLAGGVLSYAAGVFNGVVDGGSSVSDSSDDFDFVGRLFLTPFKNADAEALKGLSIGIAASTGKEEGSLSASQLPSYRSPGQASVFSYRSSTNAADGVFADGDRVRISPQLTYYVGSFGLIGEYVRASQEVRRETQSDTLDHEAWQIAASTILTGEKNSFRGVTPKNAFNLSKGNWGAFELAARYSELKLDDATFPTYANRDGSVSGIQSVAVGLNWYLNRNLKSSLTYEQSTFDGVKRAEIAKTSTCCSPACK